VPGEWLHAIAADQILTSPIVRLETLHSTRNFAEFEAWDEHLSLLHEIQLTYPACRAAIAALRELAARSAGYHRVGLGDALIAASAADVNPAVGVLHYNHGDFARLAEVLDFDEVPLAPPGTFEPEDNAPTN
jgi:predicted nucleic acid-binding protein